MSQEMVGLDGHRHDVKLAEIRRSGHFGERSLLRGDDASQVNVDAGPKGMCCLTFDFDTVKPLLEVVFKQDVGVAPSIHCDIREWCQNKEKGWLRRVSAPVSLSCTELELLESSATRARVDSDLSDLSDAGGQRSHLLDIELSRLTKVCLLGKGAYGVVNLVEDPATQKRYALKSCSKGHVKRQFAQRQVCWERELLSMVDSPFVVRLHRTFKDAQHVYFLLEAALGGSLLEVLHLRQDVLVEDSPRGSSVAFYVACITAALEHLHERRIVHRDVKPENALLDCRGYAKLCDMGFARFVLGKTNTLVGTPDYMAPEVIDVPHFHDTSADWWSLGVLAFELLAGQTPFEDEGISDLSGRLLAIRRSQETGRLCFPFHFPKTCKDFVSKLLLKLPDRLGAAGGARDIRDHTMWKSMRFDFQAFSSRQMASPFVPTCPAEYFACGTEMLCDGSASSGSSFGTQVSHTSKRANSLFQSYVEDGTGWDKDF
ncbi:unnamed protein product [Polarella glacialis]|uniref:Protein kinase domain-containing protein n=1 Tax=Polarella glacialis TaxID=89957 RepID=A0A813ETU7_POLGL|nr:unnamed protein product [Polarella glacialis]